MARIYVGTCSWSDHVGFYPPGLPSNQQIGYYAQRFPIVEINATFYRLMPARSFALWAERTPPGFLFDVKPYKQLTWHDREHQPDRDTAAAFRESLQPLREAGKLGAIHFQFPPWYVYHERNLDYIHRLVEFYGGDRLGVEFRHRSWLEGESLPAVTEALRRDGISLTVVDEPQVGSGSVPTVLEVTQPALVIARFHGRNAKTWYIRAKTTAERFDYLYNEDELRGWTPRLGQLAERAGEIHALFNNNAQDYAVQNGRQLRLLLREGLPGHEIVASPEEG
jgi:uncharacterized protein YecE (DUF72 family)